jgi:hypothetical protein
VLVTHNYPLASASMTIDGVAFNLAGYGPTTVGANQTYWLIPGAALPTYSHRIRFQAVEQVQGGVNLTFLQGVNEVQY